MDNFWDNMAITAFNNAQSYAMADISSKKSYERNKKLMALQANYNKEAADYSNKLQKDMWDYTNVGNQKKHMLDAGLNPALLYGQSGGGGMGVTGNVQQSGSSIANDNSFAMGLQGAMDASQVNLNLALANKANEEAKKIGGVDTKEAEKRISKMEEEINTIRSQNDWYVADRNLKNEQRRTEKKLQDNLRTKTQLTAQQYQTEILNQGKIWQETNLLIQKGKEQELNNEYLAQTLEERVETASRNNALLFAQTLATTSQNEVNWSLVNKIEEETNLCIQKGISEQWNREQYRKYVDGMLQRWKDQNVNEKWHLANESVEILLKNIWEGIETLMPWKSIIKVQKDTDNTENGNHN